MLISCYCLVIDTVLYRNHLLLSIQYLVFDVVSVITGLFLCYVGFFKRSEGENTLLQEPLLNGNSNVSDDVGSRIKSRGADNVTPYSTAGLFSLFTFFWMGSLIAVGYKKTLDLEDVPQLDRHDSVVKAFPIFRSKLEADGGVGSGVTTLKLQVGIRIRAVLVVMVYNKGLTLSCQAKAGAH
ncbi:hypothetical protein Patl1_03992 [Pistacia atlantica]|uniref:Uncharacterized protein n=1 Tax=Pistacia atlantica TaxID=434234 RepID=A0ACC1BXQ7_9ROSI|nr:hypothetical protein Patl1_03992 [Pistacia atlantica]